MKMWVNSLLLLLIGIGLCLTLTFQACSAHTMVDQPARLDKTPERMTQEHRNDLPIAAPATEPVPTQSVSTTTVEYATINAMYYGAVETAPNRLANLSAPLLGIFAENDRGISVDNVRSFETTLTSLDKDANIYIYEGVGHTFANPSGQNYNPPAAEDAWGKTLRFFSETLTDG